MKAVKRVPWRGDVAPIPFPFRSGLLGPLAEPDGTGTGLVDFDEAGGRVLIALRHGMLCACPLDGGDAEILARPVVRGENLKPATGLIGVSGGVVMLSSRQKTPVLAHYDFATRVCVVHQFHPFARGVGPVSWSYYPDLRSLGGRPADRGRPCMSVDLSASGEATIRSPRASAAAERARAGIPPYPAPSDCLETHASEPWTDPACHSVVLDPITGTITYRQGSSVPRSLTPMSDGHPALKATQIASTLQGGDVLGVQIETRSVRNFWFISMSRCAVVGSFCYDLDGPTTGWFALSRDGRRFARRTRHERIEVRDVPGDLEPVLILQRERLWHHFASLGSSCLLVREFDQLGARQSHAQVLIRWDVERLTVDFDDPVRTFEQLGGVVRESRSLPARKMPLQYDRARFVQFIEHGNLRFLFDQYNEVAVLNRDDRLVAMFYTSGREFAAWMPDGTCLGSARLIGGEPSKAASERIAAALRAAERGEEWSR
jgi:hypothetical protein